MACHAEIRLDRLANLAIQHRTPSSSGIPYKGHYNDPLPDRLRIRQTSSLPTGRPG